MNGVDHPFSRFQELVEGAIAQLGLNQRKVVGLIKKESPDADMSASLFSNWLHGKPPQPHDPRLAVLAKVLDVGLDDLKRALRVGAARHERSVVLEEEF